MRLFVRKSIRRGRCSAFNQYYKSIISDEVFNFTLDELKVEGNMCEILDKCFEYNNKHRKMFGDVYDSRLKTIEKSIKMKKQSMLTRNIVNYQNMVY